MSVAFLYTNNEPSGKEIKKTVSGNSLVIPWLRTHLPLQGNQVPYRPPPPKEDPTCLRAIKPLTWQATATKPACHNGEPGSHSAAAKAQCSQLNIYLKNFIQVKTTMKPYKEHR